MASLSLLGILVKRPRPLTLPSLWVMITVMIHLFTTLILLGVFRKAHHKTVQIEKNNAKISMVK